MQTKLVNIFMVAALSVLLLTFSIQSAYAKGPSGAHSAPRVTTDAGPQNPSNGQGGNVAASGSAGDKTKKPSPGSIKFDSIEGESYQPWPP